MTALTLLGSLFFFFFLKNEKRLFLLKAHYARYRRSGKVGLQDAVV